MVTTQDLDKVFEYGKCPLCGSSIDTEPDFYISPDETEVSIDSLCDVCEAFTTSKYTLNIRKYYGSCDSIINNDIRAGKIMKLSLELDDNIDKNTGLVAGILEATGVIFEGLEVLEIVPIDDGKSIYLIEGIPIAPITEPKAGSMSKSMPLTIM